MKSLLVGLLLGVAGQAHATVATSSASVLAVPIISANASCAKCGIVIKSARFCNDTAVNSCVRFTDSGYTRLTLCALGGTCSDAPALAPGMYSASPLGTAWGELLVSTGTTGFNVVSATPTANGWAVSVSYDKPNR